MSDQKLDEFDKKARKFLKNKKTERLEDILREFALCEAYDQGLELEDPNSLLTDAGVEVENIRDFTEYRLAKALIREEVKKEKKSGKIWK